MHNGANKKKCVRAGVALSQPTARQASASPRSRVSQDSSHIRPGKLKSPSFRKGGGRDQEATTSSSKRKLLKYSSWRFSLKNDRLHKTRTHTELTRASFLQRARAFTTLFF